MALWVELHCDIRHQGLISDLSDPNRTPRAICYTDANESHGLLVRNNGKDAAIRYVTKTALAKGWTRTCESGEFIWTCPGCQRARAAPES